MPTLTAAHTRTAHPAPAAATLKAETMTDTDTVTTDTAELRFGQTVHTPEGAGYVAQIRGAYAGTSSEKTYSVRLFTVGHWDNTRHDFAPTQTYTRAELTTTPARHPLPTTDAERAEMEARTAAFMAARHDPKSSAVTAGALDNTAA